MIRLAVEEGVYRFESGCFERGLNADGRRDRSCGRCGTVIVRGAATNRSSFGCPRCQRAPRS